MSSITVPGYSLTDRIPRVAFALLLGQGSRTPAQSPLEIVLIGHRSYDYTGGAGHDEGSQADAEPLQVFSAEDAATAWGEGSQLHRMAHKVLTSYKGATLWGVCVDDVVATDGRATDDLVISGPATASGAWKYRIADRVYTIPVVSADTATAIGDLLEAAINGDPLCPVWASNAAGTVTLLCRWYGPSGNEITAGVVQAVAGVTVNAITMAGGTTESGYPTAFANMVATGVIFDYVLPGLSDSTDILCTGTNNLRSLVAALHDPTTGILASLIVGSVEDAPADAHTTSAALDGGTTTYNEVGYWSQVWWAPNNWAEPWCVAAACLGLRVKAEEANPQQNWIGLISPEVQALECVATSTACPTAAEINAAILYGLSPVKYDLQGGTVHIVKSITAKHEIGTDDNPTFLENTNVPAVCRAVSYGMQTSLTTAFNGMSVVADVDGEIPDDLPANTTSPLAIKSFLLATMKKDYESGRRWVQKVDDHADDTAAEQDSDNPSRILYQLPIDVPRWVDQIVGVHQEVGGVV